jgi:hypothetical protein
MELVGAGAGLVFRTSQGPGGALRTRSRSVTHMFGASSFARFCVPSFRAIASLGSHRGNVAPCRKHRAHRLARGRRECIGVVELHEPRPSSSNSRTARTSTASAFSAIASSRRSGPVCFTSREWPCRRSSRDRRRLSTRADEGSSGKVGGPRRITRTWPRQTRQALSFTPERGIRNDLSDWSCRLSQAVSLTSSQKTQRRINRWMTA